MSIRFPWSMGPSRSAVRAAGTALALAAAVAVQPGCTSAQQDGVSPSYLIVNSINAASGAEPDELGGVLASDVRTGGGIVEDPAEVEFALGLKDPGSANTPNVPSTTNFITVTRYRVKFVRADGRNTPGVDVPYPFDGAMTVTVGGSGAVGALTLVRVQAKAEAPLAALAGGGGAGVISTIAEITFFGKDQAGRDVSVTGKISVNFADWADPD